MLIPDDVLEIRRLYAEQKWSINEIKDHFHVSFATVSRIINGRTWADVTGGGSVSRNGELTAYRCAVIEARLEQGQANHRIIGEELGISRQAVRKLIVTKNLGKADA